VKSLWNAPSLGTLRAGPQRLVTFVLVAMSWLGFVFFIILAPLWPVVQSAWRKQPRRVWRAAVLGSMGLALLLLIPWSPLFVPFGVPFALPTVPPIPADATMEDRGRIWDAENRAIIYSPLIQWINSSLIAEVALLPLVIATVVHTRRTKG
jgi:hypothetical protein